MDLVAVRELPVFLPGNNRDWIEIQGTAIIDDAGVMRIQLSPENAVKMVEQARNGILWQVSIDYRMPIEEVQAIQQQAQQFELTDVAVVDADNGIS